MIISRFEIWILCSLDTAWHTTMLPHHHHGNQPTYIRSTQTDGMDRRQESRATSMLPYINPCVNPSIRPSHLMGSPPINHVHSQPQANKPLHRASQVSSPRRYPWTRTQAQIQQWRHSPRAQPSSTFPMVIISPFSHTSPPLSHL